MRWCNSLDQCSLLGDLRFGLSWNTVYELWIVTFRICGYLWSHSCGQIVTVHTCLGSTASTHLSSILRYKFDVMAAGHNWHTSLNIPFEQSYANIVQRLACHTFTPPQKINLIWELPSLWIMIDSFFLISDWHYWFVNEFTVVQACAGYCVLINANACMHAHTDLHSRLMYNPKPRLMPTVSLWTEDCLKVVGLNCY